MNSAELPSPISAQNVSSLLDHSLKVNYKARDARFEVCLYSEATSAFALVSFHFLTFHLLSDLPTLTICQAGHPSPPLPLTHILPSPPVLPALPLPPSIPPSPPLPLPPFPSTPTLPFPYRLWVMVRVGLGLGWVRVRVRLG